MIRRVGTALVVALSIGLAVAGCGGGGGGGGGSTGTLPPGGTTPPPTGGTTPPPTGGATPPVQGSAYWHVNNDLAQPLKTHTSNEAAMATEVFSLVNQNRAANGVGPLSYDLEAERAAKAHAEDMVGRGYFSHFTPENWSPGDRLTMTGATGFNGWGENIAAGYPDAAAVMVGWMNSSGHRANILNPSFTHIGVGVDEDGGPHWVQVFLTR